jgi:hypothetical protein
MARPNGFEYIQRKNGEVVTTHHGSKAAVLRGDRAERFVEQLASRDGQELTARITGNYRRGNEKRG